VFSLLSERGVLRLTGSDVETFLNGLLTRNMLGIAKGEGRFAALLTPQGKVITDMFVVADPIEASTVWIDCPLACKDDLMRKLTLYRLKAKVTLEDKTADVDVGAQWRSEDGAIENVLIHFADPRNEGMGRRIFIKKGQGGKEQASAPSSTEKDYHIHRLWCGVPMGGMDFVYGDTFPHDANMDQLNGVDFTKGCYVGQEVVSRMHHRGTSRTRIVRVQLSEPVDLCPQDQHEVRAGEKRVGVLGTCIQGQGLAQLRVDRVQEAIEAGQALQVAGYGLEALI
jgi:tRNA-modifying protein YgfZ